MKFAVLHRVPFGAFLVNPAAVGAVTDAQFDAYGGTYNNHTYGACVMIHGVESRVHETLDEVVEILNEALKETDSFDVLAALPDPPLEALLEGHVKPKKGKRGKK